MNILSELILVVSIISVLGIVSLLFFVFYKDKKINSSENIENSIDDELVYDEITGKYVTVEELMEMQELDIITDERVEQEYENLNDDIKSKISKKDYEFILEFEQHFNIIKNREDIDEESKYELLSDILKRKGKSIDISILNQIVS